MCRIVPLDLQTTQDRDLRCLWKKVAAAVGELATTKPEAAPGYQFRVHVSGDAAKIATQIGQGAHYASPQDVADAVELVRAVMQRLRKEFLSRMDACMHLQQALSQEPPLRKL